MGCFLIVSARSYNPFGVIVERGKIEVLAVVKIMIQVIVPFMPDICIFNANTQD